MYNSAIQPLKSEGDEISFTKMGRVHKLVVLKYALFTLVCGNQGRIKLFGAPRQWKHFRPLFQAVFLSGGGYYPQQTVKHHASQSQDRNNKYFILYIEFCINNKI